MPPAVVAPASRVAIVSTTSEPRSPGVVRTGEKVHDACAGNPVEVPDAVSGASPLGWQPQQTLGAALNETLAWYREFLRAGCAVPVRAAA